MRLVREDTVRSASILREARLRAGLSQDELAKVSRKDRTVIARYEQGVVAPSLDTLVQLLRACGFDIPLELVPYDAGPDERIEEIQMLAPERRLDQDDGGAAREVRGGAAAKGGWLRLVSGVPEEDGFDPRGLLAALHRNDVSYVLIGGLARVIRGTDEVTSGVDVCPALRFHNPDRLAAALDELEAKRVDRRRLSVDEESLRAEPILRLRTSMGELNVVAEPAGTRRGFNDLRRGRVGGAHRCGFAGAGGVGRGSGADVGCARARARPGAWS